MPAHPADSAIYHQLFGDAETAALFTDNAQIAAMLQVEGALARVQGAAGLIPSAAAAFIDRAAHQVQIDSALLAAETARNGVPIPALLAAFRAAAGAPDQMQYLHWGATSQDIMDTALALRLRPLLALWSRRLDAVLQHLASLAHAHAALPMAARTYGQYATPTTFGAVVAGWGWPLLGWRDDLRSLGAALLQVSLSGAAGTLSAMGPSGPQIRADLAAALNLTDPGHSWHSDRSGPARLAGFAAGLAGSLGKLAEDLLLMTQSGIEEISLSGAGGSSTMPQKENPVLPSALAAMARHVIGLASMLQTTALHRQQRDGAAWFGEWLVMPQLCIATSRVLALADNCLSALSPNPTAMARPLTQGPGLILAEALTFALAQHMPRPQAQAQVADLCRIAQSTGQNLATQIALRFPDLDWSQIASTGTAEAEALAFAARVTAPPQP